MKKFVNKEESNGWTDHLKCVQFNSLLMGLHWDPNISRTEPFRPLKMKITKETIVKNQNLKGYQDSFNTSEVTGVQTLERKLQVR